MRRFAAGLALLGVPLCAAAGGHVSVGVGINVGPGYPYYYGPPAYYYYPYGYYPYGPSYYYYPPPAVVYESPPPTVRQPPPAYWYYCPEAKAYFPYVKDCPSGWRTVPAHKQTPQAASKPATSAKPATAAPTPAGQRSYTLGDTLFSHGKADLQPAAMATLDKLAESLAKEPNRTIVVEGYTDNSGSKAKNLELSQRRADAVMQYLIAHGVSAANISAVGKGAAAPVASNSTAQGRQQNRRVNIIVS